MRATKSSIARSSVVFAHLSVADDNARFGHETLDQVADREDRFDAVVDEVDLAAARQLVADRPPDHLLIELDDVGLNRQAILRRRLDDRHVADADERHVQRPRNRRRAHRQHVDLLPQLLDLLLVADAEPLLLVDDEQAEVAELHVLREQPVRADDDVDLAGGEVGERFLLLGLRCGTGSPSRCAREIPQTAPAASSGAGTPERSSARGTATCLPSITALNAARMATSVLP